MFTITDVMRFRRQNAETSARYERMSDAELDLEALKRARAEVVADAEQAAIDAQAATQRMNRLLDRKAELTRQIEAATFLLRGARRHD
jgi:hypothetical protein